MSEAETNNERTILDYLNEDCWRLVLQHVYVGFIIRSERVSKRWQKNVLVYLRSIHIGIGRRRLLDEKAQCKVHWVYPNRERNSSPLSSFLSWTKKLGASVVACSDCDSEEKLKIFVENCPNLQLLWIEIVRGKLKLNHQVDHLKKLYIRSCCFFSDKCVGQLITSDVLELLDFTWIPDLTGECLVNLRSTRLRTLTIQYCPLLSMRHLLAAADRLSELTKLTLLPDNPETSEKSHLLLEKLPKLEHLYFHTKDCLQIPCYGFFNSLCSLCNLKHITLGNCRVTDEKLEAVARCCQQLEQLEIIDGLCEVTGRGLAAVCAHAGPRLTALRVDNSKHITDDDVVACVRARPNLESLNVGGGSLLTPGLAPRAAAARRGLRAQGVRHTLTLNLATCEHCRVYDEYERDRYKADGLVVLVTPKVYG